VAESESGADCRTKEGKVFGRKKKICLERGGKRKGRTRVAPSSQNARAARAKEGGNQQPFPFKEEIQSGFREGERGCLKVVEMGIKEAQWV